MTFPVQSFSSLCSSSESIDILEVHATGMYTQRIDHIHDRPLHAVSGHRESNLMICFLDKLEVHGDKILFVICSWCQHMNMISHHTTGCVCHPCKVIMSCSTRSKTLNDLAQVYYTYMSTWILLRPTYLIQAEQSSHHSNWRRGSKMTISPMLWLQQTLRDRVRVKFVGIYTLSYFCDPISLYSNSAAASHSGMSTGHAPPCSKVSSKSHVSSKEMGIGASVASLIWRWKRLLSDTSGVDVSILNNESSPSGDTSALLLAIVAEPSVEAEPAPPTMSLAEAARVFGEFFIHPSSNREMFSVLEA